MGCLLKLAVGKHRLQGTVARAAQTARNSGKGSTDCREHQKGQHRLQGASERAAQTARNSGKGITDCKEQWKG